MVTKYGVTELGFKRKTYDVIMRNLQDNAKRMFGADVDLTPGSPIKILIDLYSVEFLSLWNELEQVYNAAFIDTATDASLDSIGKLVGAARNTGLYATGTITFYRNTPLPSGSPRIIAAGTKCSTAMIRSTSYVTTESVYFQAEIVDEPHIISGHGTYTLDTKNMIYEITALYSIVGQETIDYLRPDVPTTPTPTFIGRTITFSEQIDAGVTVFVTYKPLSVTAACIALTKGSDSNISINTITVMDTPIDFVHYIGNERQLDTGADVESDSHFRAKVIGATQSLGKATKGALEFYIGKVTGVKNVMIEDPMRLKAIETVVGTGDYTIFVDNTPLYEVLTITGSVTGAFEITGYTINTGEIIVDKLTVVGETLTVTYTYAVPGKIKIFVQGGETGDENTPDTIVYAIDKTRAAGIQSIGFGTEDANACGSPTARFSWFYRPNSANVDLGITIYFERYSDLTDTAKDLIASNVQDILTDYIDALEMEDKIYRNKLLQIVIGSDPNIIDAQLTSWSIDETSHALTDIYIQSAEMEVVSCRNIVITKSLV